MRGYTGDEPPPCRGKSLSRSDSTWSPLFAELDEGGGGALVRTSAGRKFEGGEDNEHDDVEALPDMSFAGMEREVM